MARDVLLRKFASLKATLEPWRRDALAEAFPRHDSQTRAVVTLLEGLQARIASDLAAPDPTRPSSRVLTPSTIENRILTAYQIWNVFRQKFAQRLEPGIERFLRPADELAWLCYEPARIAVYGASDPRAKEPPLVYLSGEASPMIDPRDARVHAEGIPRSLVQEYGWPEAATRLPFALVGVPWYEVGFLPGALAIAHEIGHAVEDDFGLDEQLAQVLQTAVGASGTRQSSWTRWRHEMFADMWGALCLGPAYGLMLADFIEPRYREDPTVSLTDEYPPAALRVYWTTRVIGHISAKAFSTQAEAQWQRWQAFGEPGFDPAFLEDARHIAAAWLEASIVGLRRRQLEAVITFTAQQDADALAQAASAALPRASSHRDVRVFWAAIQYAFTPDATGVLLGRVRDAASNKIRKAVAAADQAARDQYVRGKGESLI